MLCTKLGEVILNTIRGFGSYNLKELDPDPAGYGALECTNVQEQFVGECLYLV
jgi:hypothetical protein